jgi:hypothetical protein
MTKQNGRPSIPAKGATPARTRGMPVKGKRKPFAFVWLSLFTSALLTVAIFVLVPRPGRDVSPPGEIATGDIDPYRLGAIVIGDGTTKCTRATFDNRTGKISHESVACETTTIVNEQHHGSAVIGAARSLNSISNSFK